LLAPLVYKETLYKETAIECNNEETYYSLHKNGERAIKNSFFFVWSSRNKKRTVFVDSSLAIIFTAGEKITFKLIYIRIKGGAKL
jgi:hypothetical protein